jgi:hypothetical protein
LRKRKKDLKILKSIDKEETKKRKEKKIETNEEK